jgi:hypothetical protein
MIATDSQTYDCVFTVCGHYQKIKVSAFDRDHTKIFLTCKSCDTAYVHYNHANFFGQTTKCLKVCDIQEPNEVGELPRTSDRKYVIIQHASCKPRVFLQTNYLSKMVNYNLPPKQRPANRSKYGDKCPSCRLNKYMGDFKPIPISVLFSWIKENKTV